MAPEPPILIDHLSKRLGRKVLAVDSLNLRIDEGQVVGLCGPNGAGKSVTLKILLGLVRPSAGRVLLFGEEVRPGCAALGKVGAMVDGPGFVPHLSGRDNLRQAAAMVARSRPKPDLDQALDLAGLGEAVDRPYRTYSHGMRYRLALAQALLGDPEVLVLDEPTTGLDPLHHREIRDAVNHAAKRGATVVLSSHLLAEVEDLCSHVAIMQSGRLVSSGAVSDLVRATDTLSLDVPADRRSRAKELLRSLPGVATVREVAEQLVVTGSGLRLGSLALALDERSITVTSARVGQSLEVMYLDGTSRAPASL
jgi:ABC-2 type transport system ATP-binding protein